LVPVRKVQLALAAVIAVFAVAATYISFTVVERQATLREVSRYNVAWAVSQAVNETIRLELRLTMFGLPQSRVDADEVRLRLDILHNRLTILRDSDVRSFTDYDPEQRRIVDDLEGTVAKLDPLVERLDAPGATAQALELLSPLEGKLSRFAAAANNYGGEQVAEDQSELLRLHWLFSALAAGLILCGVTLTALLFWQNRAVHRAHAELRTMAEDLRVAKEAAEAASEAKSRFLATMSHELRTPLNAIIGFSEILSSETFGPVGSPKYREYAGDILRAGRHMHDLIGDVLTMAKLEAGHYELSPELVDLGDLVRSTVAMMGGSEMAKDRVLAIEPQTAWPLLRADARAVRQMLLNLLSNALKFSAPQTPVLVACGRLEDGALQLTVIDQGIGMTAKEAEYAVQPFQQIDNRLARKYEGTGLGLSIVKALIERHGGRLLIQSAPDAGTCISLLFPADLVEREQATRVA
jgi:two-component system, cell cycle sensor histidine kinase PleC